MLMSYLQHHRMLAVTHRLQEVRSPLNLLCSVTDAESCWHNVSFLAKGFNALSGLEISPFAKSYLRFILFTGVVNNVSIAWELYGIVMIVPGINKALRC